MDHQLSEAGHSRRCRSTNFSIYLWVSFSNADGIFFPVNVREVNLIHQQLITFAMFLLCKHPEYLEPLRAEILRLGEVQFNHQNDELPLLDSFLKETARLDPVTICMLSSA